MKKQVCAKRNFIDPNQNELFGIIWFPPEHARA